MITEKDLQEAIAECEGQRNPNANTCIKLAAFLTIKQHLYPEKESSPSYSFSTQPDLPEVAQVGDGDFSRAIYGKDSAKVWEIMDELMSTLQVVQPRLYDSIMRKVDAL